MPGTHARHPTIHERQDMVESTWGIIIMIAGIALVALVIHKNRKGK